MQLYTGTSGYSFKQWRGSFYPPKLKSSQWLAYYAERLSAVEINSTFYRMPRAEVLERWAAQVPPSFRFALKASRRITHFSQLANVEDSVAYMFRQAAALGDRLGPTLFQLPPSLGKQIDRLRALLRQLPRGFLVAFEFRNRSWFDDEVYEALAEHDAALCEADEDGRQLCPSPPPPTAGWGYLRMRRDCYDEQALTHWASELTVRPWRQAFAFFKHEEGGVGPRLAARLSELASTERDVDES